MIFCSFGSQLCRSTIASFNHIDCQTRCYRESVIYKASCLRCRNDQLAAGVAVDSINDHAYEGETLRSLFTRTKQHLGDYRDKIKQMSGIRREALNEGFDPDKVSSFMWDHTLMNHGGIPSTNVHEEF